MYRRENPRRDVVHYLSPSKKMRLDKQKKAIESFFRGIEIGFGSPGSKILAKNSNFCNFFDFSEFRLR